jgi:hypothetical protein
MDLDDRVTLAVDFSAIPAADQASEIGLLCDAMEATAGDGRYPLLVVERPWSVHNPKLRYPPTTPPPRSRGPAGSASGSTPACRSSDAVTGPY